MLGLSIMGTKEHANFQNFQNTPSGRYCKEKKKRKKKERKGKKDGKEATKPPNWLRYFSHNNCSSQSILKISSGWMLSIHEVQFSKFPAITMLAKEFWELKLFCPLVWKKLLYADCKF